MGSRRHQSWYACVGSEGSGAGKPGRRHSRDAHRVWDGAQKKRGAKLFKRKKREGGRHKKKKDPVGDEGSDGLTEEASSCGDYSEDDASSVAGEEDTDAVATEGGTRPTSHRLHTRVPVELISSTSLVAHGRGTGEDSGTEEEPIAWSRHLAAESDPSSGSLVGGRTSFGRHDPHHCSGHPPNHRWRRGSSGTAGDQDSFATTRGTPIAACACFECSVLMRASSSSLWMTTRKNISLES